jgi:cytochrome P450
MNTVVRPKLDEQLVSPAFYQDPYPVYDQLRVESPVAWSESLRSWVLTRYDQCVATLLDTDNFSSQGRALAALENFSPELRAEFKPLEAHFTGGLISSDPPKHTRLRALITKAFVPRVIEAMRPRLQELIDALVDGVEQRGEMNVLRDVAYPLPAIVIAEMLGAPPEDREKFKNWSDGIVAFQGTGLVSAEMMRGSQNDLLAMRGYLANLLAERRHVPHNDLLGRLVEAEMEGDRLSQAELLTTCVTLLTAGHETSTTMIANGLYTLLNHTEQLAQLRANPELMATAVEEMLRYESPLQRNPRRVSADVTYAGQRMRRGDCVLQFIASANRDPEVFPDPHRFDITRQPNRHLAFGLGPHFCIGAPLARLELSIALNTILRRLPGLRRNGAVEWEQHSLFRTLQALPVAF